MKRNIIQFIVFAAFTFFLSSCLKDNVGIDWTDAVKGKMYATLGGGTSLQNYGKITAGILTIPSVTLNAVVNIATDKAPTTAITVSLGVDPTLVDSYNAADTTQKYALFPGISVPATVTVPAGSKTVNFTITLTGADTLDLAIHWTVPISITGATGGGIIVPANHKSLFYTIVFKNIYEGWYHSVGYRNHPALGVIPVDKDKYLSTYNANTVTTYPADYSPYDMEIQVNADNSCTVYSTVAAFYDYTGPGLDPVGRGIAGGANTYDPALKQFTVWTYYNLGAPRIIHEVYTLNAK